MALLLPRVISCISLVVSANFDAWETSLSEEDRRQQLHDAVQLLLVSCDRETGGLRPKYDRFARANYFAEEAIDRKQEA